MLKILCGRNGGGHKGKDHKCEAVTLLNQKEDLHQVSGHQFVILRATSPGNMTFSKSD